jgi:ABC-type glycerol-3-phosphate transport system substrate-binding protein
MKKSLAVFLALAMVMMCSGMLSAMAESGEEQITLRVAAMVGFGNGYEVNQQIMNKFTDEHPNVKIEFEEIPMDGSEWNVYVSKLQTMVAAGNAPDVVDMATEGMQQMHKNGLAVSLNKYLESEPELRDQMLADTEEVLYQPFLIDGELYCLMMQWNNCITHFNMDRLAEAGLTLPDENWDKEEFLKYCEALTTEKDGEKRYGVLVPAYYFAQTAWLYAFDASFLNEDWTKAAINTPNAVECFQFMHDLIWKYGYAPVPQPGDDYTQMLIDGKVAMDCAGRWPVNTYAANNFTNVGVQYNPSFKQKANVYGTEGFIVMSTTEHYEEAAAFCTWTSSSDFIREFVKSGSCPARTSLGREVVEGLGYPQNAKIYFDSLKENMKSVESPVAYAEIATIYDTYFSQMMTDENADIQATCDKMAEEINAALAKTA